MDDQAAGPAMHDDVAQGSGGEHRWEGAHRASATGPKLTFSTLGNETVPNTPDCQLPTLRWTAAMLNLRAPFAMPTTALCGPHSPCSLPGVDSRETRWPAPKSTVNCIHSKTSRRPCESISTTRRTSPSIPRPSCPSGSARASW